MGDTLTLGDPYLFVMSSWGDRMIGLDKWANIAHIFSSFVSSPGEASTGSLGIGVSAVLIGGSGSTGKQGKYATWRHCHGGNAECQR